MRYPIRHRVASRSENFLVKLPKLGLAPLHGTPAVYITFYYQSELGEDEIERLDAAINSALAKRYHEDVVFFDDAGEERGGQGRSWIMIDISSNAAELDNPTEAAALIADVTKIVKSLLVRYNYGLTSNDIEVEVDDSGIQD